MHTQLELSFEGSSGDEDENTDEQDNYFPTVGETFDSGQIYLPNVPINIKITQVYWTSKFNYLKDRVRSPSLSQHLVDQSTVNSEEPSSGSGRVPSRYEITVTHGPFEWKLMKTYNDIYALHREIGFDQMKRKVRRATETVKAGFHHSPDQEAAPLRRLSVFPKRWILTVPEEAFNERKTLLEEYLQSIVNCKPLRYLEGVMNFFEISPITFRLRLGTSKFKEGTIAKIPKPGKFPIRLTAFCVYECAWQTRWLVLKDSYLVMLKPSKIYEQKNSGSKNSYLTASQSTLQTDVTRPGEEPHLMHHQPKATHRWYHRNRRWRFCKVILMDQLFKYSTENSAAGTILTVKNMHYELKMRTQRPNDWVAEMTKVLSRPTALDYVQLNPNDSFAPVRRDGQLLLCIDGASYMDAVANGIEHAQHEIFITDWWLSPEVLLKRPNGGDKWRLDYMLKKKAEEGVRICIMIYREIPQALPINSKHTSTWLSRLHPNIHVIRHPNHFRDFVLLWSHHEKLVVIDQSIAFMGGIDLCFGRWDRQDHPLLDIDKTKPYRRKQIQPDDLDSVTTNKSRACSRGMSGMSTWSLLSQLQDAAKSALVALMPVMPIMGIPGMGGANGMLITTTGESPLPATAGAGAPAASPTANMPSITFNLPSRSDSLSVMRTDAPEEEIARDKAKRHGGGMSFSSVANASLAALAWRKQTAHQEDLEQGFKIMPDGQIGFRSSVRTRRSTRHNYHKDNEGLDEGEGGHRLQDLRDDAEPTMDIHIPLIGRLQVPIDPVLIGGGDGTCGGQEPLRRASERRPRRLSSVGTKKMVNFGRKRSRSQSLTPPPDDASINDAEFAKEPPKPRKSKFSTADISTGIQNMFARMGSQRKRSPIPKIAESDSDESDEIEYMNLGYYKRKQSKAPFSRIRGGQDFTAAPEIREESLVPGEESEVAQLSRKFLFVGKDYENWLFRDIDELKRPSEDRIDRNEIPRMPWHDVGCVVTGSIVSDFARHFIQRWNASRMRKVKRRRAHSNKLPIPPMLLPSPPCEPWKQMGMSAVSSRRRAHFIQMQALRSASRWSLVVNRSGGTGGDNDFAEEPNNLNITPQFTERSIHNAYIEAIRNAEHYVYIENQFFVSWLNEKTMEQDIQASKNSIRVGSPVAVESELQPGLVKNMIVQALYDRILRAHREKKPFRVYIIMPLLPGFEGDAGSRESGVSINYELLFIKQSLFHGPTALIPRLRIIIAQPEDYISVCGLRTWDTWPDGRLTTEFIYVHSKIMIVDDRKLIIGSANINDRSMLGYRDSELALVAEDTPEFGALKEATFAGQKVFVGEVARRFRKSLMAEHLGVLTKKAREAADWDHNLLDDPVCNEFFQKVWCKFAESNMKIFDDVFAMVPSNNMECFSKVVEIRSVEPMCRRDPKRAKELIAGLHGHLVKFPEDFLSKEDLTPPQLSKENAIGSIVWT